MLLCHPTFSHAGYKYKQKMYIRLIIRNIIKTGLLNEDFNC